MSKACQSKHYFRDFFFCINDYLGFEEQIMESVGLKDF